MKILNNLFCHSNPPLRFAPVAMLSSRLRFASVAMLSSRLRFASVAMLSTFYFLPFDKLRASFLHNKSNVLSLLLFSFFFLLSTHASAQWILVNDTGGTPAASAALELRDTTRGFLPTRVSQAQMNAITSPATGLMVYNTDSTGYYFYNGTSWVSITSLGQTQFTVPTGSIIPFGGDTGNIPIGFLLCDGASLDTSSYNELFKAIGTSWGGGGTNFNIPDLRGRFMRGVDLNAGNDPDRGSRTASATGGNTGDDVGSVQNDEFRSHNHTYNASDIVGFATSTNYRTGNGTTARTGTVNNRGGNETRPKNANVNFIVCYSSSMAATGGTSFQGVIDASSLPSGVADTSKISDGDGDTYVDVEETTDNDEIRFYTNGTEVAKFRNGNLAIGVSNPGAGIHLTNGLTIRLNDFIGDTGITYHNQLGELASVLIPQDSTQVLRGDLSFGSISGASDTSSLISDVDNDTYIDAERTTDGDSLIFFANGGRRMTITPGGTTILTSATQGAGNLVLDVSGDIWTRGQGTGIKFTNSNIGITGNNGNSGDLVLSTGGVDRMRLLGGGQISFGTTGPVSGTKMEIETPSSAAFQNGLWIDHNYTGTNQGSALTTTVDGTGNNTKYGINNTVSGAPTQTQGLFGTFNNMIGGNTEQINGTYNNISTNGTGLKRGVLNSVTGNASQTSAIYGTTNSLQPGAGETSYGTYNSIGNTGTGPRYAFYSLTNVPAGAGTARSYYSRINHASTGLAYGASMTFSGTGGGDRYAYSADLGTGGTGTKYGVSINNEDINHFSGDVGIGTNSPSAKLDVVGDVEIPAANDYTYTTNKTKYLHIANVAYTLLSTNLSGARVEHASTGIFTRIYGTTGTGKIAAPIYLPDGAVITELRAYLNNGTAANSSVEIFRYGGTGAIGTALASITVSNTTGLQAFTDNTITNATIDNQNYYYYVVYTGAATTTFANAIYGTRITYTVDKAD